MKKILFTLTLLVLLTGFISAQANYSKCLPQDSYSKKKLEKSLFRRILLSIFPVTWINWLTSYAVYGKEINCVINETNKLEVLR